MKSQRLFVFLIVLVLGAVGASADVPERINYQGRLVAGTNLVNGATQMVFKVFNVDTGGSPLYQETQTVTVVDGLYATQIGASNSVPGALSAQYEYD